MEIWLVVFAVFIISAFFVLIITSITKNVKKRIKPEITTSSHVQVIHSSIQGHPTSAPFSQSTNVLCNASTRYNPQISFNQPHTPQVINDNLPPPPYHSLDINQLHNEVT